MHKDRPRYVISRPAYTLPDLDEEFEKKIRTFPIKDKVWKLFRYWISILTMKDLSLLLRQ